MHPIALFQSSLDEVRRTATTFIAACGYETRSAALASTMKNVRSKHAVCFEEHPELFNRGKNENTFRLNDFAMPVCNSYKPEALEQLVDQEIKATGDSNAVLAFDISSMTRAWHGCIIRKLAQAPRTTPLETYFIYAPAVFQPPSESPSYNEIVAPVEGFASLAMPNAPTGLVLGLGYDKDKSLGLQELLDPKRTVLMVPRLTGSDEYYSYLLSNNSELLTQVPSDAVFEYPLLEPIATFGMLESISEGMQRRCRVVLASLGPKLFGMLCLILAAKNPELSVWQATSGIHADPRDAVADLSRVVVVKVVWGQKVSVT